MTILAASVIVVNLLATAGVLVVNEMWRHAASGHVERRRWHSRRQVAWTHTERDLAGCCVCDCARLFIPVYVLRDDTLVSGRRRAVLGERIHGFRDI